MTASDSHRVVEPSVLYVGTPVYLVATLNHDQTPNLAPASSHWALGRTLVLGLETDGQTLQNLTERPALTINFPTGDLWRSVERLSAVTGRQPIPEAKADHYGFVADKFGLAQLTMQNSELVSPPRVLECPLQFEALVRRITPGIDPSYHMVEAEVIRVHAAPELIVNGTDYINPSAWRPLIYSFRHYFDRGEELGWTRKSRTQKIPEEISRWEQAGGTWTIHQVETDRAVVGLYRCDGGEEVSRLVSDNPTFVAWAAVNMADATKQTG